MSTAPFQDVLYAVTDRVARITINRPEKRNALGARTLGELIAALALAREDDGVGAIILTGAGTVFCAGGDLSQMSGGSAADGPTGTFVDLNLALAEAGKPTIAMVQGHATAGGLALVLGAHLAIAADSAEFGLPEIKRGLWPMMIMATLFRNLPRKQALELILSGERISAAHAVEIGLINRAVPADRLEQETLAVASKVAGYSPAVMRLGLGAFARAQDMPLAEQLQFLQGKLFEVLATDDAREGLMAFMEKREPKWTGR